MGLRVWALSLSVSLVIHFCSLSQARADDVVLMAYGGHNETIGPYWVATDKGLYQKHSIDARLLQVRNAQISLTALISGEVPIFLPSIGNVLSGVSAGAKIGCVAFPIKGVSRELVVRKEIESLAALRGKTIGVQSIGGGFWLQTMMVLDGVGVDPDKIGMKMRVIGEEPTIVQALLSANIDAAVVTLPSARRWPNAAACAPWSIRRNCASRFRPSAFVAGASASQVPLISPCGSRKA